MKKILGIIHKSRDGGGGVLVKASRNRHEGGRVEDFLEPTKCDFDIFPFFFYDLPMNLVAFVQDFQNRIVFDIDTFIANIIFGNRRFRFSQL